MDTPTTQQGGTDKMASTTGTSGTTTDNTAAGMEPSTPTMGASASTPTANPTAGDINVDDGSSRQSGLDTNQSGAGASGQRFARAREQAREQATKLKDQATDRARSAAETGKHKAVETIDGLAQAARETADRLGEQNPQAAEYARKAADAIGNFSRSLEQKNIDDLVDDARQLVRRSPGVAIGAAVAAGFILARFLKATSPARDTQMAGRSSYRTPSYDNRIGSTASSGSSYRTTTTQGSDSSQSFTA